MDKDELAKRCAEKMWAADRASHALGIEIDVKHAGESEARMTIRDDMVNGLGVCHGGLVFALADTAFAFACNAYGTPAIAASCQVDFLLPANLGDTLIARATEDHRGSRSSFYSVTVVNQDSEVVAVFRGRSANQRTKVATAKSDT